jgi:hypothetical protein
MLNSYLSTGKFNNELFDELYYDLENFLYNERTPITIVVPLHNFDADIWDPDSINLDNGLLIRKITKEERNLFWKNMVFNHLTFGEIVKFEYVIQSSHSIEKFLNTGEQKPGQMNSSMEEAHTKVNNVISAPRLQKSDTVGYSYIDSKDTLKIPV